ncbi:MAG: FimV/HubP family polar landmark protein [Mariprofundus sp.]|nr:FimV/HubP family polar landmark protein [Mariprofundus sp.]
MNMLMFVRRYVLFVLLLSMPVQALALGFGKISLESHLNQNLKATIPMLLNASDDVNTIRIELASAVEYKQLGLQWQPQLSLIRVSLHDKHSDQPVVYLSSAVLMHAPMLSILLKAKKSGRGTYFKHYQLLLDSAEIKALRAMQPTLRAITPQSESVEAVASLDDDRWARIWRYGPVQRGDSLSVIAYRLRTDKRYSNRQVMLSLYENNRAAFGGGDINRLIKGVWLNVPKAAVVEQYSSPASMQKLAQLLARQHVAGSPAGSDSKADVAKVSVAKVNVSKVNVLAKSDVKKADPISVAAKPKASSSLRYSGKISMQGMDDAKTMTALKQDFAQQFGSIHQRLMAGKLQMTHLDETVSALHVSMQVVKQDIQTIKHDIAIIKMHTDGPSDTSFMTWQLVLIVILMLVIALLLLMMLRKNKHDMKPVISAAHQSDKHASDVEDVQRSDAHVDVAHEYTSQSDPVEQEQEHKQKEGHDVEFTPSSLELPVLKSAADASDTAELSLSTESAPLAEAVIQLLNQIEESLGQCDFDKAEEILHRVQDKWPDSLRASALQAQLFYETDRLADMNDLINNISTTSDEQRWEQFCYFLPSHVWNACFGDGAIPPTSQRPDQT